MKYIIQMKNSLGELVYFYKNMLVQELKPDDGYESYNDCRDELTKMLKSEMIKKWYWDIEVVEL